MNPVFLFLFLSVIVCLEYYVLRPTLSISERETIIRTTVRIVYVIFFLVATVGFLATLSRPFGCLVKTPWYTQNVVAMRTVSLPVKVHSLTVFCFSLIFIWFFALTDNLPFHARLFATLLFCYIGYGTYDTIWGYVFWCYLPNTLASSLGVVLTWITVSYIIPFTLLRSLNRIFTYFGKKYRIPAFRYDLWFVVILICCISMGGLIQTNFFPKYIGYSLGSINTDPHGWVWFWGKLFSSMAWLFVVRIPNKNTLQVG